MYVTVLQENKLSQQCDDHSHRHHCGYESARRHHRFYFASWRGLQSVTSFRTMVTFMTKAQVTKDSIDLGIVVCNIDNSLAFYRDLLGFELQGTMPMPGGGMMHRLLCGTTTIKLVNTDPSPSHPVGGPITAACGYRYFTISVSNLEDVTQSCKDAGHKVQVPPTALRPGIMISIVEDPDGNLVEFLQMG